MTLIQIKRGLAASWVGTNPVLAQGEFGFETDTHKLKVGTGLAHWNDLDYLPLTPTDLGLDQVDNTSDLDKPVSTDTQAALDDKSDVGHGHTQTDILGLTTDLLGKEPSITVGTVTDYWRGDKSWVALDQTAVGLGSVDNTADADKPISTATQTALDDKADDGHGHATADITGLDTALSGIATDISGLDTAVGGKEPAVTAGTTGDYYRGDKSFQTLDQTAVGLGNVDDTSDATKNSATATLTSKTISGASNTLTDIPQSAVTDLATDLAAKEATANKGAAGGYASLDGGGKVPVSQLPNSIMEYQGLWNAFSNSPTLADGTGSPGDVYRVSVAASRDLGSGSVDFVVGDYVIYSPASSAWEKADTTDAVPSVNGYTGNVNLVASDVGLGNVDDTADADKAVLSATKLATSRTINGVAFDGTADITAADPTWGGKTAPTGDVVGTTDTQTLSAKTLTNPTLNGYTEGVLALGTVGAASTLTIVDDSVITATLTASTATTFTMPTAAIGKSFTLMLRQAAVTGNGSATFTGVKWSGGTAPTITATAGRMDILTFFSDGVNFYGSASQNYTP